MAKFKLTMRNSLTMVLAFLGSLVSPNVYSQDVTENADEKASPKAAGKEAKKQAKGSLSAGAIAAAVAAAAAIAAVIDSGDGGGAAPVPTPAPTPAPTTAPAPTPAPTETYEYSYYVPTVVNVNTNTNTSTTTQTLAAYAQFGVFLPNVNTSTNTNTNTTTQTLTRYVTNTNTSTSTATATNTSTNTNTTTSTVTQTFGTDADSDGLLQASELNTFNGQNLAGTDFLFTDSSESLGQIVGENANGYYDLVINQDIIQTIVQGEAGLFYINGDGTKIGADGGPIYQDIIQEIPLMNDTVNADGTITYTGDTPPNPNVDDNGATDLSNITVIEVLADGFVMIQQDFLQQIDQDIVQDVFYETDLVQEFVQEVGINQTYTVDVLKTETRTRLVGE